MSIKNKFLNNDSKKGTAVTPNYGKLSFKEKLIKRFRNEFAKRVENTFMQFISYPSFWHYYFRKIGKFKDTELSKERLYLTQKPDYGAGIGHQLANWNSGFYFSNYFGLKFAHSSFSSTKWEEFLGFGEGEVLATDLQKLTTYKKIRLPRFDSSNNKQMELIGSIINSYSGQNVLFQLEINQGYWKQYETAPLLSDKFFHAKIRQADHLVFEKSNYNISIHIRRRMAVESEEVWKDRGLENNYFVTVLESVLAVLTTNRPIHIYLFSQGNLQDFEEFASFDNFHYCLEMNPYDSFLHMVNSDLLISSKSSFSYKPALISKGIKICPITFWHGYPQSPDFILADNDGKLNLELLKNKIYN